MTLAEFKAKYPYITMINRPTGMVSVVDNSQFLRLKQARHELLHLSDYVVSSVTSGPTVNLVERY